MSEQNEKKSQHKNTENNQNKPLACESFSVSFKPLDRSIFLTKGHAILPSPPPQTSEAFDRLKKSHLIFQQLNEQVQEEFDFKKKIMRILFFFVYAGTTVSDTVVFAK